MSATVLIVDDSATIRQQANKALTEAGFTVQQAKDGLLGKARIEAGGIDIVICDVNMPHMNGIEMLTAVKSDPRFAQLPIVMLTTEGSLQLVAEAKKAGATGWMMKPFWAEKLVATVTKLTAQLV